ncbi:MAG: hypothetical protein N2169_02475, partial [bacterium]|nr:hypothetical protein [bacterium]
MKEKEINTQKANVLLLALFVVMFVTSIIAIVYISNKNILFSNREIDKNYKSYYPPLRNINYKISLIRKLKQEDKNYIIFNVENPEKITYSYQYFERMESQMRIENIQSNTEPQIHDPKPTIAF